MSAGAGARALASPSKLRVGIFVIQFPTPSETFIVTKVLGLLDAGVDVQVFSASRSPYWERFDALRGRDDVRSRVHHLAPTGRSPAALLRGLGVVLGRLARHPLEFCRFALHCWRARRANTLGFLRGVYWRAAFVGRELDVLHVEFDSAGLGVVDLKEFLRCKLLLSSRGTFQRTSVSRRHAGVYRQLFRHVDGYHFISSFLRQNTRSLGLPPEVRSWLIQPAVDVGLLRPPPAAPDERPDGPFRILSVGRLSWEKGYEFAIDAVARLVERGMRVEYTILGEGEYREAVTFAAEQRGLLQAGVVRLPGAVPREAVVEYYRAADALLHAALDEGFCNAVIEAQAMEVPVVTTDAGGLPENVVDGETGFVVPRRDPEMLAEKLWLLGHDPALRRRMGEAGRRRVLREFDLAEQVVKFRRLYHELTGVPSGAQ